jgi:hypothetical protein
MKKNLKKQNLKQIKKLNKEFDGKSIISFSRNYVPEPFTVDDIPSCGEMDPEEYMDLIKYLYDNADWEVRWAIRQKFHDIDNINIYNIKGLGL